MSSTIHVDAEWAGARVKVACINWGHPDAPKGLSYILRDDEMIADWYDNTWEEALARGNYLARLLATPKRVILGVDQ